MIGRRVLSIFICNGGDSFGLVSKVLRPTYMMKIDLVLAPTWITRNSIVVNSLIANEFSQPYPPIGDDVFVNSGSHVQLNLDRFHSYSINSDCADVR